MKFKSVVSSFFLVFFISSASQASGDLIPLSGTTKTGNEFNLIPFNPSDPALTSDWQNYLSEAKGLGGIIPDASIVQEVRDSINNVWFIYFHETHCGVIYAHVEKAFGNYSAEISYFVGRDYRRSGFASASLKKVVEHLERRDRLPSLDVGLKIPEGDVASEGVAQQAGFVKKLLRIEVSPRLHGHYWERPRLRSPWQISTYRWQ